MIEYFGWILWLSSIAFEHTADLQKKKFVRDCIKNKIKNAVCDVGLWRYRYLIFLSTNFIRFKICSFEIGFWDPMSKITDYGHTMAKFLILCGPNSNPK